jgi:hypothetical protein
MSKHKNKTPIKDTVCGVIFCIWFFGSMIAAWVCKEIGMEEPILALLGQIFLVMGILAVYEARNELKKNIVILIVPYIGFGITLTGVLNIMHLSTPVPCLMLCNVFSVAGLLFGLQTVFTIHYQHTHITYPIHHATCKELKSKFNAKSKSNGHTRHRMSYCPVYTIYYQNQMMDVCNREFTNYKNPKVGENCSIYINPYNPDELTDKRTKISNNLMLFISAIFIASGIIITIMFIH